MKKLKLLIEGMHCASCAGNVERSLKTIKGVSVLSVNVLTKKATIEAEDSVSSADLEKAISKTGFKLVKIE